MAGGYTIDNEYRSTANQWSIQRYCNDLAQWAHIRLLN